MKWLRILAAALFITVLGGGFMLINIGQAQTVNEVKLPDLIVFSAQIEPKPQVGGAIEKIVFEVRNQGNADAGENELKLTCLANNCRKGEDCGQLCKSLDALIKVPALKKGEAVKLEWKPAVPTVWLEGRFSVVAIVDFTNQIKELDETNNAKNIAISMTTISPVSKAERKTK